MPSLIRREDVHLGRQLRITERRLAGDCRMVVIAELDPPLAVILLDPLPRPLAERAAPVGINN
jgi:hypothetical protein